MEEKLSGLDSAFLSMETQRSHMHVTAVVVLDLQGRSASEFRERLRALVRARMRDLPPLHTQLEPAPLELDHPRWVESEEIDLDHHIRSAGLPAPGSDDELAEEVARIAARPLDRTRPLWEMWVLEGLARDRVALVAKMHHAAVDGVAGAELMAALFDDEPDAPVRPQPAFPPQTSTRTKNERSTEQASLAPARHETLVSLASKPVAFAREAARTGLALGRAMLAARSHDRRPALPFSAPRTPFNATISPHRQVALSRVPLADLRRARRVLGVKINDLVLAACTQALRRYLLERDELPDEALVAAVPTAVDSQDEERVSGNKVSVMFAPLPVHIDDPIEQLREISRTTRAAKRTHRAAGPALLSRWAEWVPPLLLSSATNLYSRLALADRHDPVYSAIVSNVMGPPVPLYCAGFRIESCYPLGPIYDGSALNLTVLSYAGQLHFGALGCANATPDLADLARDFRVAVDRLVEAAERRRGVGRNRDPVPVARSARRQTPGWRARRSRPRTGPELGAGSTSG